MHMHGTKIIRVSGWGMRAPSSGRRLRRLLHEGVAVDLGEHTHGAPQLVALGLREGVDLDDLGDDLHFGLVLWGGLRATPTGGLATEGLDRDELVGDGRVRVSGRRHFDTPNKGERNETQRNVTRLGIT